MALFFICHLSSVISVINNKTPERFGSVVPRSGTDPVVHFKSKEASR